MLLTRFIQIIFTLIVVGYGYCWYYAEKKKRSKPNLLIECKSVRRVG